MKISYYHVDAFSSKPFSGNPAAVCITEKALDDGLMQQLGAEFNLPATTFLYHDLNGWHIRWYAPGAEIKLCGHGSLAAAKVLYEEGYVPAEEGLVFITRDLVEVSAYKEKGNINICLPLIPVQEEVELPEEIAKAFGVDFIFSAKHKNGFLLRIASEAQVRNLSPDFNILSKHQAVFIVTAEADKNSKYDFVSRVFVPFAGTNEDPVTGSAHACLASYWLSESGRTEFKAYQASGRGGEIELNIEGNNVYLTANAIILGRGYLEL